VAGSRCAFFRGYRLTVGVTDDVPARGSLSAKPPSGPAWVHEIKHDGYRLIVRRTAML
jgi:hypothetical protein